MSVGIKYFIILLCCVVSSYLWGDEIDKRYLTNQDGLSNSSINCILQDSCGLLWFGTWDGLNMFNSREIQVFKPNLLSSHPSISNNIIRNIIEEKKGIIWIATDYGINRYNRDLDEFQNYFCTNTGNNVIKEQSFFLAKDAYGHIYVIVNEYGIYYYNSTKRDFVRLNVEMPFNIKKMFFDKTSQMWLCTESNELYYIKFNYLSGVDILVDSIRCISKVTQVETAFYDGVRDVIWTQTDRGLVKVDPDKKVIEEVHDNFPEKITAMVFKDSYCYVGTLKGLYKWNIDKNETNVLLKDISINSLFLGEQHILWVGTDTRGVVLLSEKQNNFIRSSKMPTLNFGNAPVRAFWETRDGTLLIGTKGKGLFLLDKNKIDVQNVTVAQGLMHNSVYAFAGNDEYVWICTEGNGLNYYSVKEKRFFQIEETPEHLKGAFSICAQNDTILWVGTNGWGLFKLVIDRNSNPVSVKYYKQYKYQYDCSNCLNNNSIFSVLLDGDEGLWVGTRGGGLNYLDFATEKFHHYRYSSMKKGTISNDDILCLYKDSVDNTLWVGTSNGLNHLISKKDSLFHWYTEKEGIPNNTIHGILKDKAGNLWMSTNRGLARLDNKKEKIVSYFMTDGLQDDEFSDGAFYQSNYSDKLYFGGMNGYTIFDPLDIKDDAYKPKLYLAAFSINNNQTQLEERLDEQRFLDLSYKENLVTFRFVPVDHIQGSKCEVAYMIEGYTNDWVYLGTSGTIVLNNLPSGEYTLHVKCCNANKEWSHDEYIVNIRVYPPWWLSGYAYLGYIVILILCIAIVYRNSVHRIRMRRKLELEKLENQKAEEIHQAKLRFFTNIAHEFCNSLTLIYGPSERLFKLCGDNPVLKRYLSVIKSNAERMQALIQQLMEFRKAETGYLELYVQKIDVRELVEHTTDNFRDIAEEKNIIFTTEIAPVIKTWNTDRSAFEKILFNLLSNAFKYTPERGIVSLNITLVEGCLHLVIRNTGKGIRDEEKSLVFNRFKVLDRLEDQILNGVEIRTGIGLALCKALVDLLKGTIKIESKLNEYTAFVLQFPMLEESVSRPKTDAIDKIRFKAKFLTEQQDVESPKQKVHLQEDMNTLLVIDDDPGIRLLLTDILQDQYNVLTVANGREALELLKKCVPDLIICDIIMPGMNGFELIEQVKKQELTVHIPVILLSSDASVDSKIESAHIGADAYLTKPFYEQHLLATISQLLSNRKGLKDYFNSPISSIEYIDGKLVHKEDKEFIYNLTKIITADMSNDNFSLDTLTAKMGISKMQLYRKLKDIKNETPTDFIRKMRLKQAEHLLKTTNETVSEIMYKCGFNNKAYFYRLFLKEYNMTPKEYRESVKR